jgi:ABC-type sugar transport system permease subunit/ABC-type glycerol-3-phosphate transport system substrate-binding protein
MKLKILKLLPVMLLLCNLTCRAAEHPGEPVKLTVWALPRPDDTGIDARCHRAVINAFQKKYPHIILSAPTGIEIPEMSAMDTKPLMAIAGGVSPDVIYVNFRQSDTYIQEGFLYPLDQWLNKLPKDEQDERILPQIRKVIFRRGPGNRDGSDTERHYYALPYGTYVKGLCWRKDLFQSSGLDPERPPKDWQELLDFARRCTNPLKGTYGLAWTRSPHWSAYFYSILCSAGARAMEERGDENWYASFNSPSAVTAYEFIVQLLQGPWRHSSGRIVEGVVCRDDAAGLKWAQGQIAIIERYFTDDLLADINPELVGIAPVPAGPDGRRSSEINCAMCGIFSGTAAKGRETLEAAWQFVHFMGSREAKDLRTTVLVENGYGIFANPVTLERLGYTDYLRRIPQSWRDAFREAVANGEPEPYGRNCQMIYNYMAAPADQMQIEGLGHKPPEMARQRIVQILNDYVQRANERMIGHIPPAAMKIRRIVATMTVLFILAGFAWLFRYVTRVFTPSGSRGSWQFSRFRLAYFMLLPAVLLILLWRYVPMFWGATMALQDYHILLPSTWTGIDNFAAVLWDPEFWQSLRASLWYAFLSIVMGFFAPIALAILLHEVPRGKVLLRTLYYLPAVISGLVVMLMWKNFFEPSDRGLLNQLITGMPKWGWHSAAILITLALALSSYFNARNGHSFAAKILGMLAVMGAAGTAALIAWGNFPLKPQRWLENPRWAMPCIILPTVWAGLGPGCLIYLAALKTIPDDLYEAADLDGAGFFGKIWHVTIPTISILIFMNFIGAVINAFRVAEYILAMTGGGPAGETRVLALKVFYDAFVHLRFGFATATAWILGAMLIGFTVLQMKRLSNIEFKTADSTK